MSLSQERSATSDALHLYEVLEHILLGLDMRTLLQAQRVSTTWHRVINRSHRIQERLFYRPVQATAGDPHQTRKRNQLLEQIIWPRLQSLSERGVLYQGLGDFYISQCSEDPILRSEASWRQMLIQQPPAVHVCVARLIGMWELQFYTRALATPDCSHLQFGMVYELLRRHQCCLSPETFALRRVRPSQMRPNRGLEQMYAALETLIISSVSADIVIITDVGNTEVNLTFGEAVDGLLGGPAPPSTISRLVEVDWDRQVTESGDGALVCIPFL
ncbi:hypothetical protein FE257_004112 [Aspergillus nanangensis]|uniref:F-box domain-containing protein n=1 Tax=Aspergillus nanangensis TaxID=2582783 RepID=A0AAD4GP82_ASPNN|nr:hypothetical protein FE257_004112 [Aspergillus nanangensis]